MLITGLCSPAANSSCVLLTVGNAAAITTQPVNTTVCEGANAVFTVTGSGSIRANLELAGEYRVYGFNDIPAANTATLTLNAVTVRGWLKNTG